ncbi:glycosyltransferase family 39 protein [Kamptonema sp. UHCC 0994]|nr:glycosyltransferase family 39 protein [Kamptonema sp. UHCC 0994]
MKSQLQFFIIVLLVIGICFRFSNLGNKFYWYDEVFTSLRVSGYTEAEVLSQVADGRIIAAKDLMQYQQPNSAKHLTDTIRGLAVEEPQLPPLYFIITRFWVEIFGSSPTSTRSLSASISLLAFPCLYWLCQELFSTPKIGWLAVGFVAVSPFHLLYAQEARPYSLWAVIILLTSASLLRALRLQTKLSWSMYATSLALGLYTHLFTGLVAIGNGIYVFIDANFHLTKRVIAWAIASVAALITFLPWLVTLITNKSAASVATNWSELGTERLSLINNWAGNIGRIFIDFGFTSKSPLIYLIPLTVEKIILLILIGYALYFLGCQTPKRVWLFVAILIGSCALPVMLVDLIDLSIISTKSRYLFPTYMGIEIAVAYLLVTKITVPSTKGWKPQLWRVITILLLGSGLLSSALSLQADNWWNKESGRQNPQIARIVNETQKPLVLSDTSNISLGQILSMSHLFAPKVSMQLFQPDSPIPSKIKLAQEQTSVKIVTDFSDVFIYGNPDKLRSRLEQEGKYKIEAVDLGETQKILFWKLVKS